MEDFSDTRIQVRRGTASEWSAKNPILGDGEPGYDLTNKIFKIGDGTTRWASLSGVSGASDSLTQEDLDQAISNLINSAPETLDTLNEIAAAINNNASFFETVAYSGGDISQFNNDAGYLQSEANDLTSSVTWTNVPDANITESSVVQHSGALRITESQIVDLQNYIASGDNVSTLANDANYIISDNSIVAGSDKINNIINLSQAEYDAITPSTGVLYVIEDAPDPITSLPSSGNWDAAYSWVASNSGVVISSGDNISLLNNDLNYVESDTVGITGASGVNNVVIISQADYDNIGSGNYDPNTIYFVT